MCDRVRRLTKCMIACADLPQSCMITCADLRQSCMITCADLPQSCMITCAICYHDLKILLNVVTSLSLFSLISGRMSKEKLYLLILSRDVKANSWSLQVSLVHTHVQKSLQRPMSSVSSPCIAKRCDGFPSQPVSSTFC